jgi:hypothetical protein
MEISEKLMYLRVESKKLEVPLIRMKREVTAIKVCAFAFSCAFSLGITSISYLEYNHAAWTKSVRYLPFIASAFRSVYLGGLAFPILTSVVAVGLKPGDNLVLRAIYGFGTLAFLHISWFIFWLTAMCI